jgi:hypothetical protein
MKSSYQLYLSEVLEELFDMARVAKADYAAARTQRGDTNSLFEAGRALAFYESFDLLVTQLDAFAISRESVGLAADLDVERELL